MAPITDTLARELRSTVPHNMPSAPDPAHQAGPGSFEEWPTLITSRVLAGLLNVSERTLERRRLRGDFIPFKTVGRRILYAKSDVIAYLEAMTFTSTAASKERARRHI